MPKPAFNTLDIESLLQQDSSTPIWEDIVKTYITEEYEPDNCKEIVTQFVTKFLSDLDKLKSHGFEVIDAANRGYDVWIKEYLQSIQNPQLRDKLINAIATNGMTAMNNAIGKGHSMCFNILLEYDADPNLLDGDDETPSHKAAMTHNPAFMERLMQHPLVDLTLENHQQNNPLMLTVLYNTPEVTTVIVNKYPNFANHSNGDGKTPLHMAAKTLNIDIATLLLDAGADVNKGNPSPLFLAVTTNRHFYGDPEPFVKLLVSRGVKVTEREMNALLNKTESSARGMWRSKEVNLLTYLQGVSIEQTKQSRRP
jgi:hypothetical protein